MNQNAICRWNRHIDGRRDYKGVYMKYEIAFNNHCVHARIDPTVFRTPDTEYYPVYSWIWHTRLDKDEICRQLDSMYSRNIRNLYIIAESVHFRPNLAPTMLEPDYYTDEYLRLWHAAVSHAASKGMNFWLYDEDGWPSGSAGHAVVRENPGLAQKRLTKKEIFLPAGGTYDLKSRGKSLIAAFRGRKRINCSYTACAPYGDMQSDPDKAAGHIVITEFWLEPAKQHAGYPDILNPESAAEFIRLTHEKVRAEMREHIGGTLKITFTDEPAAGKPGFNEDIITAFGDRYGYDICDYLPALFDTQDLSREEIKARQDYYELVGETLANSYFIMLKKWCSNNGMLSSGHLGGENDVLGCINGNSGFYQPLRMLRCFDIPGVDAIWRQIFPGAAESINGKVTGQNNFFPRYASSAANQNGSNTSVTESYAVYGAGLTYAQMRYVQNYQFVRGINLLNVMNMTYEHVDFLMGGIRPSFPEQMPGAGDVAAYNLHSARLTYLMTAGKPYADTALYMPFRDFQADLENSKRTAEEFERIGFTIEKAQGSFDVIDDDLINNVPEEDLSNGVLRSGYAEYRTIFLPHCRHMTYEIRIKLEKFVSGGGKAYMMGEGRNSCDGGNGLLKGAVLFTPEQIPVLIKPVVRSSSDKIRAVKRITEDGELYFLYNEGFEPVETELYIPGAAGDLLSPEASIYEFDTITGEIRIPAHEHVAAGGGGFKMRLFLHFGEGRCYLIAGHTLDMGSGSNKSYASCHYKHDEIRGTREMKNTVCLIENFTFRRIREFVIGEHNYESWLVNEAPCSAEPGKWPAPDEFSGDAAYVAGFVLPELKDGEYLLDLGDVRYSCEAVLNGHLLGIRCMPPYSYTIDSSKLCSGQNRLEVRVSNTAANQFVHSRSFDKWTDIQMGPYHKLELNFESESVDGGLYGPVRLMT
ncbi:MAG: glycosyl hydrolase [Eubacteriales bacterium]|nr:glycosyl hydrolase [Eubacteriales bacterium]